jgi:hypothetical protein
VLIFQVVNNHIASTGFEVFNAVIIALLLYTALRIIVLVLRIRIRHILLILSKATTSIIRKQRRD